MCCGARVPSANHIQIIQLQTDATNAAFTSFAMRDERKWLYLEMACLSHMYIIPVPALDQLRIFVA